MGQNLLPLSAHLFILYWAMLSYITPPVALGAYAAASIASANPLKTGFAAMRLGSVIYVIPFIFVLDPSFILEGSAIDSIQAVIEALVGVWLIVGGLQGYLTGFGRIDAISLRILLSMAGLMIALPDINAVLATPDNLTNLIAGVALAAVAIGVNRWRAQSR
jgi:TRAP-type uncharacterized transport system fused permease subunit